jgi:hypothetical protein
MIIYINDSTSPPLQLVISDEDVHRHELLSINLHEFDVMTPTVIRKKFNLLLQVRQDMKQTMTATTIRRSGEHQHHDHDDDIEDFDDNNNNDNNNNVIDAYHFVDEAMENVGSSSTGLTTIGCYYFYVRCEAAARLDGRVADTMDAILRSNNNTNNNNNIQPLQVPAVVVTGGSNASHASNNHKKRAYEAFVDMSRVAVTVAEEMKETHRLAQENMREKNRLMNETNRLAQEKNRLDRQAQMIALAQHLGKRDLLEEILARLVAGGDYWTSAADVVTPPPP